MDWKATLAKNPPKQLWYEAHGTMVHAHHWQNTDDFTVIFIHGAIANNMWWQHIACQLDRGLVLSVDLTGHGLSDWDAPYTLTKHAKEIDLLIDLYAKGPVYIVGHSYGGAVAALAAAHKDVEHAVLVDTPLNIALEHKVPSIKSYQKYVYSNKVEAISRFKPIPNQPVTDQELLEFIACKSLKKVENGYVWQFDPTFHKRDISVEDQALIKPMLANMSYWYGEHSPFATEMLLNKAKELGLALEMIPNAYHAVMLDNPAEILRLVKSMLAYRL